MMLLFMGSVSTWALFLNIFLKSPVVWLLLPYDLLLNNLCLFLLFPQNHSLYVLLCFNCHQFTLFQCFFPNLKSYSDANCNGKNRTTKLLQIPSDSALLRSPPQHLHLSHHHNQLQKKKIVSASAAPGSPGASTQSGMVKQPHVHAGGTNMAGGKPCPPPPMIAGPAQQLQRQQRQLQPQHHICNDSYSDLRNLPQVPMAFGARLNVDERQNAAMQFYRSNAVATAAHTPTTQPSPSLLYAAAVGDAGMLSPLAISRHYLDSNAHSGQPVSQQQQPTPPMHPHHAQHPHHHHMQTTQGSHMYDKHHLFPSGVTKSQSTVTATKSDPSYLHDDNFNMLLHPTQQQQHQHQTRSRLEDLAPHSRHTEQNHSLSFSASNIIKAIVTGVGGKLRGSKTTQQNESGDIDVEDDEDEDEEDACEHEPLNFRQNETTIIHQGFVDHVFRISARPRDDDDDDDEEEEEDDEDEEEKTLTIHMMSTPPPLSVSEDKHQQQQRSRSRHDHDHDHCRSNMTMIHIATGSAIDEEDEDESQRLNHCEFDCTDSSGSGSDSFGTDDESDDDDDDIDGKCVVHAQPQKNLKSVSSTRMSSSQTATHSTLNTRSDTKDNMGVPNFAHY